MQTCLQFTSSQQIRIQNVYCNDHCARVEVGVDNGDDDDDYSDDELQALIQAQGGYPPRKHGMRVWGETSSETLSGSFQPS